MQSQANFRWMKITATAERIGQQTDSDSRIFELPAANCQHHLAPSSTVRYTQRDFRVPSGSCRRVKSQTRHGRRREAEVGCLRVSGGLTHQPQCGNGVVPTAGSVYLWLLPPRWSDPRDVGVAGTSTPRACDFPISKGHESAGQSHRRVADSNSEPITWYFIPYGQSREPLRPCAAR